MIQTIGGLYLNNFREIEAVISRSQIYYFEDRDALLIVIDEQTYVHLQYKVKDEGFSDEFKQVLAAKYEQNGVSTSTQVFIYRKVQTFGQPKEIQFKISSIQKSIVEDFGMEKCPFEPIMSYEDLKKNNIYDAVCVVCGEYYLVSIHDENYVVLNYELPPKECLVLNDNE